MITSPVRFFLLPAIAGLLTFSGCATYRNATAYFNTYYNASKLYDEAVADMMKSPQAGRDSNYFAPYKLPQPVIAKFERVIEKGSRVIQFHGESGYVEDAILMIGRSYLFQNETESAAAKFRELLDNFPESDQRVVARLWLARALYQGGNEDEAVAVAKELSAPADGSDAPEVPGDVILEAVMLEAQIYSDRGDFAQAAEALGRSVAMDGEDRLKAIAQYQLGAVYEETGDYVRAAEAFGLVGEYNPTPSMNFNARLRRGVMLSLAGSPDGALETFDEVIAWRLEPYQFALVDLEIANAYWEKGDSAAAFTLFEIIDSTYKNTDASARSYFKRGEILEKQYRDLPGARKFFEKAKSEFPASAITPRAVARFASLERYFKTADGLSKDDSTLRNHLNPDTLGSPADTSAHVAGGLPDTSTGAVRFNWTGPEDFAADSVIPETVNRAPPTMTASDNLSMRSIRSRPRHLVQDPDYPDEGSPDGEGASPEPADAALAGNAVAKEGNQSAAAKPGKPAAQTPLPPDGLRMRIAEGHYELGGIFLLDLDLPDSALVHYETLVGKYPESPLVPKALYAMSEAYRIFDDSVAVDSLYDKLLTRYPETEYADQVRKLRGLDTAAAVESSESIRYKKAEAALNGGDPTLALAEFKSLAGDSRDTLVSPKACYAVGWIYENSLIDLDSADAWYRKLIKDYPASVYADNAEPKVAVRGDTAMLEDYVKVKRIEAVPKPHKINPGQPSSRATPGKDGALPPASEIAKPPIDPDADEYYNPAEDEEEEEVDPDAEPTDPDDPGRSAGLMIPGTSTIARPV